MRFRSIGITFSRIYAASLLKTQDKSFYPKLLQLLRPLSLPNAANLLGWHAEGPFLQLAKRGAHSTAFLRTATQALKSFDEMYGPENLVDAEDWLMADSTDSGAVGVRIITAAPEVAGVMDSIPELTDRGIVFSIGHR